MDEVSVAAAMLAGATVIGLVQALKDAGLPTKFARLAAIVTGTVLGTAAAAISETSLGIGAGAGFVSGIGAAASYAYVAVRRK